MLQQRRNVREFTVNIERSANGVWELSVVGEEHACGHAAVLSKLDKAIEKMLGEDLAAKPGDYVVHKNLRLAPDLRDTLAKARNARDRLEGLQQESSLRTRQAVVALRDAGLSYRDIADLLGVTHQRVQQLLREMAAPGELDETSTA